MDPLKCCDCSKPGVAYNEYGDWLCENCLLIEAYAGFDSPDASFDDDD